MPAGYLIFKDVKKGSWDKCLDSIAGLLVTLYHEHRYLLDEKVHSPEQAEVFTAILHRRASSTQCEDPRGPFSRPPK